MTYTLARFTPSSAAEYARKNVARTGHHGSKFHASVLSLLLRVVLGVAASLIPAFAATENVRNVPTDRPVTYEAFGALGDGKTDDLPAIFEAHAFANVHGLPLKSRPDATYHLGRRALTAVIATDTDWSTSRFIIDDRDVEDFRVSVFAVRSLLAPIELSIPRLTRDQRRLDVKPPQDCYVQVQNENKRLYIRRGLNQNSGTLQKDCFILRRDGTIEGAIDWDYDTITKVEANPMDERPLLVKGGVFTTTANQVEQGKGYTSWARNISINRSNTTLQGVTHHIVGETDVGQPYRGFITAVRSANITLRDCFFTGHKTYSSIGAAGKPVDMGTYDVSAYDVVNFSIIGCRMDNICDPKLWGVAATSFCKNILVENSTLSRMDTHQGVSGFYTIRGSTLGHAGLNAIGRGVLSIENSTLMGNSFLRLRGDYGSTWEGTVVIRNSRWVPNCGAEIRGPLFDMVNDGQHDFGYPCFMPREITIDGLVIEDRKVPADYKGPFLFRDPDGDKSGVKDRPFPYRLTERVTIRNLSTSSGLKFRISSDSEFNARVRVIGGPAKRATTKPGTGTPKT
jgi:hypothetical protein